MTAIHAPATEKPIDEGWQARALVFVIRYRKRADTGPTFGELWAHMSWPRHRCSGWIRMQKLAKRGLVFTDEPRSLDVTEAGKVSLGEYLRKKQAA